MKYAQEKFRKFKIINGNVRTGGKLNFTPHRHFDKEPPYIQIQKNYMFKFLKRLEPIREYRNAIRKYIENNPPSSKEAYIKRHERIGFDYVLYACSIAAQYNATVQFMSGYKVYIKKRPTVFSENTLELLDLIDPDKKLSRKEKFYFILQKGRKKIPINLVGIDYVNMLGYFMILNKYPDYTCNRKINPKEYRELFLDRFQYPYFIHFFKNILRIAGREVDDDAKPRLDYFNHSSIRAQFRDVVKCTVNILGYFNSNKINVEFIGLHHLPNNTDKMREENQNEALRLYEIANRIKLTEEQRKLIIIQPTIEFRTFYFKTYNKFLNASARYQIGRRSMQQQTRDAYQIKQKIKEFKLKVSRGTKEEDTTFINKFNGYYVIEPEKEITDFIHNGKTFYPVNFVLDSNCNNGGLPLAFRKHTFMVRYTLPICEEVIKELSDKFKRVNTPGIKYPKYLITMPMIHAIKQAHDFWIYHFVSIIMKENNISFDRLLKHLNFRAIKKDIKKFIYQTMDYFFRLNTEHLWHKKLKIRYDSKARQDWYLFYKGISYKDIYKFQVNNNINLLHNKKIKWKTDKE